MSGTKTIRSVELYWKPDLEDPHAERVRAQARRFLGMDVGRVRRGKCFTIGLPIAVSELMMFAQKGLKDEVIHDMAAGHPWRGGGYERYLLIGKLPGVTDDEGMAAQRTLLDLVERELDDGGRQHVFAQEITFFGETLTDEQLRRLGEELLGNPLVHHIEWGHPSERLPYYPEVHLEADGAVELIDLERPDDELLALSRERVLSLNLLEMQAVRDYYRREEVQRVRGRQGLPAQATDCELEILAQTWSEHCKHKEFNARIRYSDRETGEEAVIDSLFHTFIRGSTERIRDSLSARGDNWLVKVFSDNAGVVRIDRERLFVFKVETHNSPSALDPYGGAITGILGNNRDPLGTGIGGGRLLFNTDVLCFGPPDYGHPLLPGQLHPSRVMEGVRHGIEDGGNKSGVPTVNGAILFDDRYAGKPLVYCGTGSILPDSSAGRPSWVKEIAPGDHIVMAGGRVGKDGIHGATFSSAEIDKGSPRSAVQVGSPITQKLLSDFLEEACASGLVKCATDNGAGGLSSSVGELAELCGGARVELAGVPLKYAGLRPWEIFVSESQERMTLVVEPGRLEALLALAARYDVEATPVGRFTDDGLLDVRHDGACVACLDLDFLHHGLPRKEMAAEWVPPHHPEPVLAGAQDWGEALRRLLGSYAICSREAVIRQYDHEVKGRTVVKPLMGPGGCTPQDAAVVRLDFDSHEGIAVSNGICPQYGDIDGYAMAAGALDEAVRQIISVGGALPGPDRPGLFWSVNDNFCMPDSAYDPESNPDGRFKLAQLVRMCRALYDLSVAYGVPMTSGKDSMKNDFKGGGKRISVPPTVLFSAVARIADVRRVVTSDLKASGDAIYLLGETREELGGSAFHRLHGAVGMGVPKVVPDAAVDLYRRVAAANDEGLVQSSHDLSDGGLAVALAECTFGTGLGAAVELPEDEVSDAAWLFGESHSRFVVTVKPPDAPRFEALLGHRCTRLGEVTPLPHLRIGRGDETLVDGPLGPLMEAWRTGLAEVFHG